MLEDRVQADDLQGKGTVSAEGAPSVRFLFM
jgi:hypothetical protein